MLHIFRVEIPSWKATIRAVLGDSDASRVLRVYLQNYWVEVDKTIMLSPHETLNEVAGHAEIAWRSIIAFRHRVAHGYFELSLPIVWDILTSQIPELHRQLAAILSQEFPPNPHGSNH